MQPPAHSTGRTHFLTRLIDEFQLSQLPRSLLAAGLIFSLEAIFCVSFTALVYTNELGNYLPFALGLTLLGDALLCGIVGIFSSYRGAASGVQDVPAAILTITIATALGALPLAAHPDTKFATVLMLVLLTTLLTSAFFVVLGHFKLGGLARFLPYPVIGGFLAGTGWLLTTGALSFSLNIPLSAEILRGEIILQWLPPLIFGLLLLFASHRSSNPAAIPGLIVAGVVVFYVVVEVFNIPLEQLRNTGWLLAQFPTGGAWSFPLNGEFLANADWPVVLNQLGSLAPIMIISVVSMLLNLNGLELILKRDIDLNRELVITGIAGLVSGMAGGLPGYSDITASTLNKKMTGGKRLVTLLVAAMLGLTVFVGAPFLAYIPKMVLAGVIFYIGFSLLFEWTYQAWSKFPRVDFLILLAILLVIATRGFLEGVTLGLVAAIILFVINYSRTSVIKHTLSGVDFHSRVNRSLDQLTILEKSGEQLHILELQGFIFFGTANSLYERVKNRLHDKTLAPVNYIVLDFMRVTGLDSTGLLSFDKLLNLTTSENKVLVFTGLSNVSAQHISICEQLTKGGFVEKPGTLHFFLDLDHGIEWCEDQIISKSQLETEEQSLVNYFADDIPTPQMHQIIRYMERQEFQAGEYLIREGEESNDLFFIESGEVTSQIQNADKKPIRLETIRGGRTVGELGFFLNIKRSADVIANKNSVAYRLTRNALAHMEQNDSEAALAFHRFTVHFLGERVMQLTRSVQALQR